MEFLNLSETETGIPLPKQKQGCASKIFVGNLPFKITSVELTDLFNGFGTIIGVNIRKDRMTDKAKGFAFVTFDTTAAAALAMENMHGKTLEGRPLTVRPALARGQQTTKGTAKSAGTTEEDVSWATAPPKRKPREDAEERTRRIQNGGTFESVKRKGKGKRKGKKKTPDGPKSWTSWAALPDPSDSKATTSTTTTTKPTATARKNKTPTLTLRVQYKGAGPTHVFAIQLKDTILSIKQQLENINGVPTTAQRIVFAGKDVLNNATVEEMNLHIVPKSFVLKVWPAKGKP